jgi:outer membrane immunogenic protein
MRPILVICESAAAILFVNHVFAADLPTSKAPPAPAPVAAPVFSWSGFYAGLNAGYDWGQSANGWIVNSTTIAAIPPLQTAVDSAGSHPMNEKGAAFGGQIGYMWQATPLFVFGGEATLNWNGLRGSLDQPPAPIPSFPGYTFTDSQKLQATWTASLRTRLGVTPSNGLMVYGLGGVVLAGIQYSSVFDDTFNEYEAFKGTRAKVGWILGAGVEYALNDHWSARIEYAYSQYGAVTGTGSTPLTDGTTAVVDHSSGTLKDSSLRLGLNYRLGQ